MHLARVRHGSAMLVRHSQEKLFKLKVLRSSPSKDRKRMSRCLRYNLRRNPHGVQSRECSRSPALSKANVRVGMAVAEASELNRPCKPGWRLAYVYCNCFVHLFAALSLIRFIVELIAPKCLEITLNSQAQLTEPRKGLTSIQRTTCGFYKAVQPARGAAVCKICV